VPRSVALLPVPTAVEESPVAAAWQVESDNSAVLGTLPELQPALEPVKETDFGGIRCD
jgi:hypothetical protein